MTERGEAVPGRWATGNRKHGITVGDLIYWLRQGTDRRGIVGCGRAASEIYSEGHWRSERGKFANYVDIEWDIILPIDERLDTDALLVDVPDVPWNNLYGSGVQVAPGAEAALHDLWDRHVAELGRQRAVRSVAEVIGPFVEGSVTRVPVNRYERNPQARAACIEHHGAMCAVCGFDFAKFYGPIGDGVITVHHLGELSMIGEEYEVDPVKDLIPVCDNCHRMLHTTRPAMKLSKLRNVLGSGARVKKVKR